jgi:two-component system, OmpR family, phosphate regulon sensor histidine kinase PhoR
VQHSVRSDLLTLGIGSLLLGIFGALIGHVTAALALGAVAYLALQARRLQRLQRWLSTSDAERPPDIPGIWGAVAEEFYRHRRDLRREQLAHANLAARVRQITAALEDGLILLDRRLQLDWWNDSAARLLKLRSSDRGSNITNLIRNPLFTAYIQQSSFDQPLELYAPQDEKRTYQYLAGRYGQGEVVLVVRDITRLRRLEELRKVFVANVSHELRTPLTVMVGYLETMADQSGQLPETWRKVLPQMQQQARRLTSLTDDLLTLSQLESTPPAAKPDSIELHSLLQTVAGHARDLSRGEHEIVVDCPAGLALRGVSKELYSAFTNLAFNAVRHNPKGCRVTLSGRREQNDVLVEVSDDGMGIDRKHLPHLTERFYRVDEARTAASGGSGLGLAIVKHVLARHQGQLEIDSQPGKGSTFRCRFTATADGA